MANISNRSPWVIKVNNKEIFKARSKKQAQEHLDNLNNPKAILKQLETVFEVQIRLKDRDGNQINRTSSFDTYEQAEAWANEEEGRILKYKKLNGKFDIGKVDYLNRINVKVYCGDEQGELLFDGSGFEYLNWKHWE